jgi:hypothetical protein
MCWTAKGLDLNSQQGQDFSSFHVIKTDSGAHPVFTQWVPGYLSSVVKLTTHLATSVEVKNL